MAYNRIPKTKEHSKKHFLKRCEERGLDIMDSKLADHISKCIKRNNIPDSLMFYSKQSNSRFVYKVIYKEERFYLVWNNKVNYFCTVLTQEMMDYHKSNNWKTFFRSQ